MTVAMWFTWMLRADIRGDASIHDPTAQRNFVCWWLCFGKSEYPAVWWYGHEQQLVALELLEEFALPRMLVYAVRANTDLKLNFMSNGIIDAIGLLCWYRIAAPNELCAAPALPQELIALTERPVQVSPWSDHGIEVPHMAVELWKRSPRLQVVFAPDQPSGHLKLRDWFFATGRNLLMHPSELPDGDELLPPPPGILKQGSTAQHSDIVQRWGGVNLVGYPRGELGIGEDVRMMSVALQAVGTEHVILDVPFGPAARREDVTVAGRIHERLIYPVTIFCLTAFETADLYLRHGLEFFSTGYRIGNWPWELPRFPDAWRDVYALVDEVWAASRYSLESYRSNSGSTPLHLLRPAVAVQSVRDTGWRSLLEHPDAFTFVVPFDPYSSFQRKNPIAAVRAFQLAFATSDTSVALLLRVNGDPSGLAGWPELRDSIAGDHRIRCMTTTLDRAEALGIVNGADCLVSPHRAEGFGRNIAEAKLLGIPVLATGFSGNVDFTSSNEWIRWQPVDLKPGEYPHADGLWWAEPDISDLAKKMHAVRNAAPGCRTAKTWQADGIQSIEEAGARYGERIRQIVAARVPAPA